MDLLGLCDFSTFGFSFSFFLFRLFFFSFRRLNFRNLLSVLTQILIFRLFSMEIQNLLALFYFKQRRLCNIDKTTINKRFEISVEQRQNESSDMCAIDISIGCNDNFVITKLGNIESVPYRRTKL